MARPIQLSLALLKTPKEAPKEDTAVDVGTPTTEARQEDLDRILATGPQLDMDLARRAHNWTSFTPEKRAEQAAEELRRHLTGIHEELASLATTEQQRALVLEEMTRYKAGYLTRYHAMLEAKSRTASPMITGRANFPTATNQKRMETERRRGDELLDWQERAFKAMVRAILEARTPEQAQEDEWRQIKRLIDLDMATVKEIDSGQGRFAGFNRTAFVTSAVDKIRRVAESGRTDLATRALVYIQEQQAGLVKPFITNRNSIWRVVEEAQTRQEAKSSKTGDELIAEREGLRAVRNHELDRLQIFFDRVPPATVRELLKLSGWHWSPSQGAWQRKITPNAEYALQRFLQGQPMPREASERER